MWLANYAQVQLFAVTRPLLYSLTVAVISVAAGLLIFRRKQPAGIFASLLLMLFLSYGRIFDLIDMKTIGGFLYGRHRYLIPIWLGLFAAGTVAIIRARFRLEKFTRILNIVSLFLIGIVLAQVLFLRVQAAPTVSAETGDQQEGGLQTSATANQRDVYYIILDAYERQDVLAAKNGVDTSDFVNQLEQLGFVILDCAQSNYVWTPFSLGSSLNMNYLDTLGVPLSEGTERIDYESFKELLQHSQVRQKFEAMGYRTVTFNTVYQWLDIKTAITT